MTSLHQPSFSFKQQQVGEPYRPKERNGSSFLLNRHWKNQNLLQAEITSSHYSAANIDSQAASSEFWVPQIRAWRGWKQGPFCRKGLANSPLTCSGPGSSSNFTNHRYGSVSQNNYSEGYQPNSLRFLGQELLLLKTNGYPVQVSTHKQTE